HPLGGEGHRGDSTGADPLGGAVLAQAVGPALGVLEQVVVAAEAREVGPGGGTGGPRGGVVHVGTGGETALPDLPVAAPHAADLVAGGDELAHRVGGDVAR